MCKTEAEGGQRCASYTRAALAVKETAARAAKQADDKAVQELRSANTEVRARMDEEALYFAACDRKDAALKRADAAAYAAVCADAEVRDAMTDHAGTPAGRAELGARLAALPDGGEATGIRVAVARAVDRQRSLHQAQETKTPAQTYEHPQGGRITVFSDGEVLKTNAAGKVSKTSATAEKLAGGHGRWELVSETGPVAPAPADPSVPRAKPGQTFKHPQGSTIVVNGDGSLTKTNAAGKKSSTSATPESLAAGEGGWADAATAPKAAAPAAPSRGRARRASSPSRGRSQREDEMVEECMTDNTHDQDGPGGRCSQCGSR